MIDPGRVQMLFLAAVEQAPARRHSFLDNECGPDAELFRRVASLLKAHGAPGSFLESSPALFAATAAMPPISEAPGTVIGPYKLLEQIGEGGFGVVFMAVQERPVRRRVALKVIKPGMDTRQVIARFEAERQALALMDHPNIARVLDAGATETGRPYFVMELVRGLPITEYCDERQLTPRERLELFVTVCHAVQHAHQKGIIHRDIKPTNVLVTLHDDKPVVKVIDFGVAKATVGQLTDKTLFTGFAQMVGTPLYMSPEQTAISGLDVDTRSDIYSLGVLLYELLTGSTPFDRRRLQKAAYDEIRRIIREEEPQKPSTRLSSLGRQESLAHAQASGFHSPGTDPSRSSLASIAAHRRTEPHKLRQLIRGDLDWIVMKALEKDRARRYQTANALAADVVHHLMDEPVQACPPSAMYRFRKFARRNRAALAIAASAILLVALGVATLAVSNVLIRQEQARTRDEKDHAEQAQQLAEDRAKEIREGLERLKTANAWSERGRWYAAKQQWNDADAAFTKAVEARPDHAGAWSERGELFARLGLWDLASADFAREFELREPDTTMRWYRHALLRLSLGDTGSYRQVRRRMRERFGGTHDIHFAPEVVRTSILGNDPQADLAPLVELAQHVADSARDSWFYLYLLGIAQYRAGNNEQAVRQLRESLTAGPDLPVRALSYPVLAMAHFRRGEAAEARQALQSAAEVIDRWTAQVYGGPSEGRWVVHQGAGAEWPIAWWDLLEFRLFYREATLLIDGASPPDDPRLLVLRARAFAGLRRNFTADDEYAAILQRWPDDPQIRLEAHRCAGYSAAARRQLSRSAAEFTRAAELAPDEAKLWEFRAVAHFGANHPRKFQDTCLEMLERFEKTTAPRIASDVLFACVLSDDAVSDKARLLALARIAAPAYNDGPSLLGAALYRAGRCEDAVECFEAAARKYRPRAWDWTFLAMAHHRLGHADEARRCLAKAARWIEEANRRTEDDLTGTQPAWFDWYEPIVFPLLLHEAEELLKASPAIRNQEPEG